MDTWDSGERYSFVVRTPEKFNNLRDDTPTDDGYGSIPISRLGLLTWMTSMPLFTSRMPLFMTHFKRLGLPLDAVLNQEKTE